MLESTLPATRTYTYEIDGALSANDLAQIAAIPGLTLEQRRENLQLEVEKVVTLEGLSSNDVSRLPAGQAPEPAAPEAVELIPEEEAPLVEGTQGAENAEVIEDAQAPLASADDAANDDAGSSGNTQLWVILWIVIAAAAGLLILFFVRRKKAGKSKA